MSNAPCLFARRVSIALFAPRSGSLPARHCITLHYTNFNSATLLSFTRVLYPPPNCSQRPKGTSRGVTVKKLFCAWATNTGGSPGEDTCKIDDVPGEEGGCEGVFLKPPVLFQLFFHVDVCWHRTCLRNPPHGLGCSGEGRGQRSQMAPNALSADREIFHRQDSACVE